ncbi:MAG: hypothetical protein HY513_00260 [Candidatus Aenigmarchaeota archaeon]|nr:hypothetical protein [Candidatus Aenigmarchaeota archaeon]
MRITRLFTLALVILLFAVGFSFAQSNDTSGTPDPCAGVSCSDSKITCPDGTEASCSNSCSAGTCSQCTPSCAGHESAPLPSPTQTTTPACPTPPLPVQCNNGEISTPKYDSNNCLMEYACVVAPLPTIKEGEPRACPTPPLPEQCQQGQYSIPKYENNCLVRYECVSLPNQPSVCPSVTPPICPDNQYLQTQTDPNGCVNYRCEYFSGPAGNNERSSCGNGICEAGEENSCQNDCISAKPACPAQIVCFDQTTVKCYQSEMRTDAKGVQTPSCKCDQCPIPESRIPAGCVQEKDEKGFVRVRCENQRTCPEIPQDVRLKCVDGGGSPRFSKDPSGCEIFNCDFGKRGSLFSAQQQQDQCPKKEDIDAVFDKCKSVGVPGVIAFENGCNVARCAQQENQACNQIAESEVKKIKETCAAEGSRLVRDFDKSGCPVFRCEQHDQCPRDPPAEAFQRCAQSGGELVVRKDQNGCMAFANCIGRGDERNSYVERPTDVPDTTELLSIAFRLESLRIDLQKLAAKTDDIAKYYESTGSEDKERFKRVSGMFKAAVDKVDEIREKLRNKVDGATIDDVVEIKQDIKYIKDIMLKDILYLMLSKDAASANKKSTSEGDCGTDESCFGNALRVCKPITFYPEGDNGPKVMLKGLEGDTCIMYVVMEKFPGGQGPPGVSLPVDMTCKLKNYALGMRGSPEEEIFPYCEGKLLEIIKQYGTEGPGGPGGCKGSECDAFCSKPENRETCQKWAEEHGINAQGKAQSSDFNNRESEKNFERGNYNEVNNYQSQQQYYNPQQGQQYYDQGYGQNQYAQQPQPAACIGCFNNGACDANECPECVDCSRRSQPPSAVQSPQPASKPIAAQTTESQTGG